MTRCMADPGDDVITQCIANDLSLLGSEAYLVVTGRSGAGPVRFLDDVVATKALGGVGLVSGGGACEPDWHAGMRLSDVCGRGL